MSILYYIVAFIVVFSTLVFIVLFGRLPAFKGTLVGRAHILIWHKIPAKILDVDRKITGGRLCSATTSWADHLVNDKNWAVMVFYSSVLTVSLIFFFREAWPRILSPTHRLFIPMLAFQPYFYLYLAAFTDPGTVTKSNVARYLEIFPYDDIIFYSDMPPCRTCHLPKPARSKHCSVCKGCIAKNDHHCAWVNNCLGYYNYRFFLGFVLSNLIVLSYGSYLTFSVLFAEYKAQYYPQGTANEPTFYFLSYRNWILLVHSRKWTPILTSLFMISTLLCPLVIAFLAQHILYIHQGMTTNESEKWGEVQWVANHQMLDVYENRIDSADVSVDAQSSGSEGESETSESIHPRLLALQKAKPKHENKGRKVHIYAYEDGTFNRLPPEGMIRTSTVPHLDDVVNIYDKGGFFKNLSEVLFPKYV
ncbi:DHHC palmitoyltransferase-domain-containing protein [Lipomyces oligophaga]|uniref:DHHC palmitoyltransferase-domain-containing protein n=1 Tax=Lipomyces oligophaga TaxID=45792 RepID=UPI0034CEB458